MSGNEHCILGPSLTFEFSRIARVHRRRFGSRLENFLNNYTVVDANVAGVDLDVEIASDRDDLQLLLRRRLKSRTEGRNVTSTKPFSVSSQRPSDGGEISNLPRSCGVQSSSSRRPLRRVLAAGT